VSKLAVIASKLLECNEIALARAVLAIAPGPEGEEGPDCERCPYADEYPACVGKGYGSKCKWWEELEESAAQNKFDQLQWEREYEDNHS
jgi:hypothetical protein